MSQAGAISQFLDEVLIRSAAVPGTRPGSAIQDVVLTMELGAFFIVWLREWPRVTRSGRPLFTAYAVNLLCAALWCALGAYIHLFEPLPTTRTTPWLAFLGLGAVTPVLFPLVSTLAFKREPPTLATYVPSGLFALIYALIVATGADFSFGGWMPKELVLTPWGHAADGRSYGGASFGITFDLMSSYPCYRGDSMFMLSTFFIVSNMVSIAVNYRAMDKCKSELRANARKLACACTIMLMNCISILFLIVVYEMSMTKVFDVFHAVQGLVMAYSFSLLRSTLHMKVDGKSA